MLVPILLFAISGLGIVSLLGIKIYQFSAGANLPLAAKRNVVESKIRRVEKLIQSGAVATKNAFHPVALKKMSANTGASVRGAYFEMKKALTSPGHWLDRHTRSLVSMIRGRQHLPDRGEPSSYMRDISHR